MENIYFQPNKENSEFLAKLEKLDEYTIPQILERMVDHFRNLPELEDALNKLGIKIDSLEEELADDIKVEERFWVGGKPKRLRHFKGDDPNPIFEKEWYQNGQLKKESITPESFNDETEITEYYENGQICWKRKSKRKKLDKGIQYIHEYDITYYSDGQVAKEYNNGKYKYYDPEGKEMKQIEWSEAGYGMKTNIGGVAAGTLLKKDK